MTRSYLTRLSDVNAWRRHSGQVSGRGTEHVVFGTAANILNRHTIDPWHNRQTKRR